MPRRALIIVCASLAVVALATCAMQLRNRVATGQTDYVSYYVGGRLAGSHHLYDVAAYFDLQQATLGRRIESIYGFSRLPWYALLHKPLSRLPYLPAHAVWLALNAAAIVWFLSRWRHVAPDLIVLATLFPPAYLGVLNGQDVGLLLCVTGLACAAMRRDDDCAAGLCWALCSMKYHLFVLVPLALLAARRWKVLAWSALGLTGLLAVSLLLEGPRWPAQYLRYLQGPDLQQSLDTMPNVYVVLRLLGITAPWGQLAGAVAVAALAGWVMWRRRTWPDNIAAALMAGILIAPHCYAHDTLLLLVVYALITNAPARYCLVAAMFPLTVLLLLSGSPGSALLPFLLLTALLVLGTARPATRAVEC